MGKQEIKDVSLKNIRNQIDMQIIASANNGSIVRLSDCKWYRINDELLKKEIQEKRN